MLFRQLQTGPVTGSKQLAVFFGRPALYHRAYGMQYKPAGKIERRRDFRLTHRFRGVLFLHQSRASGAKLNPGKGVDGIINTAMAGYKTAEHLRIRRVDNRIAFQRGDIAPPEVDITIGPLRILPVCDTLPGGFFV